MSDKIQLYGYVKLGELLDVSPFVAKLEGYLRLAKVPHEKHVGDVRKAPRKKLPYIVHAGQPVTDSQRIIAYLAEKGVCELDSWLDANQRAELFALRSMVETDLYFIIMYFRWQLDVGWNQYRDYIGAVLRQSGAPGFLIGQILKSIRKGPIAQVNGQGTGRRSTEENLAHARQIFGVLANFVERREGPWWFGDKPSSADAIGAEREPARRPRDRARRRGASRRAIPAGWPASRRPERPRRRRARDAAARCDRRSARRG
jgi:glutathione S-transferase